MNKFDYVIILCSSEWKISENGKYKFFDELKNDVKRAAQMYLGGHVRMEAAVDISRNVKNFIVVGGSEAKVTGMRDYLLEELQKELKAGDAYPKIIRIESEADTTGNLWAIKKWIKKYKIEFSEKRVGILTNFYHIPRALRFAVDILPEYVFVPISAEAVIKKHQPTYSFYIKEFLLRLCSEVDGLKDWENERYRNQNKHESEWKSICHDKDIPTPANEAYYRGNFYEDYKSEFNERKGWLVGRFMDGFRKTEKVSVKYWQFKKGDEKQHGLKYEKEAIECNFILKGEVRGIIDGKETILKEGNYVVIYPMIKSNLIMEVISDCVEGLTIKAPSLHREDSVKITQSS